MSIETYLEHLRNKPSHIRKRYSFFGALGITAIISAFWLGSFSAFGNVSQNAVSTVVDKAGTPAQSLVASVGSAFADVKDLVFGAKKITYSNVVVLPGKK